MEEVPLLDIMKIFWSAANVEMVTLSGRPSVRSFQREVVKCEATNSPQSVKILFSHVNCQITPAEAKNVENFFCRSNKKIIANISSSPLFPFIGKFSFFFHVFLLTPHKYSFDTEISFFFQLGII